MTHEHRIVEFHPNGGFHDTVTIHLAKSLEELKQIRGRLAVKGRRYEVYLFELLGNWWRRDYQPLEYGEEVTLERRAANFVLVRESLSGVGDLPPAEKPDVTPALPPAETDEPF